MDAHNIAREILYVKQSVFDYRDKPGGQLAQVLSGLTTRVKIGSLKNQRRRSDRCNREKARNFG